MKAILLTLICGLMLAACASLNEEECRSGDWTSIGFADGSEGRLVSFLDKHAKACREFGITPDRAEWLAGRTQGLTRYCTPAKAYLVGREGHNITPVCSARALNEMQPAWDHGRMYWRILTEIRHLESDRRALRADIAALEDTPENVGLRSHLFSRISFIDLDILHLRTRLRRYDSWPP